MSRPCSQPERLLESDTAAFWCLPVYHTVVWPVMGTASGAITEPSPKCWSGAVPQIPVLSTASLLFNAWLYFHPSVLSLSIGVFDQKECTDKIETYIYPSLLPSYIREKHLHMSCEYRNNLVFDCTSGFPKYILIRHSGNIMVLLPREGFHFYYFCRGNCSGFYKIRSSNHRNYLFWNCCMKEIKISVSQLL